MTFQARLWRACVLAALVCVAACASAPSAPASIRQIVSTTSFGMCVGYCTTRLEISEGQAILIRDARGGRGGPQADKPEQRITEALSPSEWQEFARLATATDLDGLPPVIGCPDCADGGAESLTIGEHSVSFEFGAAIPQAQPLLDRIRGLRTRMMPAE